MGLLAALGISLLNVNFVMIYFIHKMLASPKNNLNYVKDSIFECFFKVHNRIVFKKKKDSQHIMMQSLDLEEETYLKI